MLERRTAKESQDGERRLQKGSSLYCNNCSSSNIIWNFIGRLVYFNCPTCGWNSEVIDFKKEIERRMRFKPVIKSISPKTIKDIVKGVVKKWLYSDKRKK